jgi:hypothetical protein
MREGCDYLFARSRPFSLVSGLRANFSTRLRGSIQEIEAAQDNPILRARPIIISCIRTDVGHAEKNFICATFVRALLSKKADRLSKGSDCINMQIATL